MAVKGREKLTQYLADAHSNETALIQTLSAHIRIAEPGPYRTRLESHLRETQSHEQKVRRRLEELGAHKSLIATGFGFTQNILKNTLSMAKAPVDMLRAGGDVKERMLRNARDEAMTEVAEIATYDTIERIANNLGDEKTAELASEIRADEERMLEDLRGHIPTLTDQVVRTQVPLTQRMVRSSDDLPIANYENLSAADVNKRLSDLSQIELRQVESYERANQNRKTVLERIESLKGQEPWPGYDELTVAEITSRLSGVDDATAQKVRAYERGHKNRKSVLEAAERELVNA